MGEQLGRVVVDVVVLEATSDLTKPYARDVAAWIEAGRQTGSNQPVEVAETELGPLYRLALQRGLKLPRNAGEISAMQAADLLGPKATVADVFVMTRAAGLPLPRPPREQEEAELARALKILGLE